jgi:hypothetical protein
MATFIDKENPLRSADAGFMPAPVHDVFLDSLTQIDLQKRSRSATVHFVQDNAGERRLP